MMKTPHATHEGAIRWAAATLLALWALVMTGSPPLAAASAAAGTPAAFRVRYVSADYVYLDAGTSDGLAVGDTLAVSRGGSAVATLQVAYATDHSASCGILTATGTVGTGDAAQLRRAGPGKAAEHDPPAAAPADSSAAVAASAPKAATASGVGAPAIVTASSAGAAGGRPGVGLPAVVTGFAALQWYHYSDRTPAGLDFDRPALLLHLKARRIWGRSLTFEVRGRAQHDRRARSYADGVPAQEWDNRVYTFSLAFDDPDAAVNWQAGRISSNAIAATGPVDGLLVESRLSSAVRLGAFGGALPDLNVGAPNSAMQKYGVYLRAAQGDYGSRRLAGAVAGTAEYHGRTVSRQYLYVQSEWQSGRRWSLYEAAELDLNTAWRRAETPGALTLSNLYLTANWRPSTGSALGLSYDSRRNYRDWDNRSLADSLFDDALRHGLRALVNARLGGPWRVYANGGWRGRVGGGDDTWSWAGGLSSDRFLAAGWRLTLQAAGFRSALSRGLNPSLILQKSLAGGHSFSLSGGSYRYRFGAIDGRRTNSWLRVEGTGRLAPRLSLTGQYEHDWGDDTRGERLLGEMSVNF